MYPSVIGVTAGNNYVLAIEFDNGECGILDMKPFLELGVFKKLKGLVDFKQVKVAFDTIEWSSGVDLDPEFVYKNCLMKGQIDTSEVTERLELVLEKRRKVLERLAQ